MSDNEPQNPVESPEFQEYFRKAAAWLDEHWGPDPPCSVCSNTNWTIAPMAEAPLRAVELGPGFAGKGIPLVPVVCNTCAHIVWFNAIRMGLSEPDQTVSTESQS